MDVLLFINRIVRVVVENYRGYRVVIEEFGGIGDIGILICLVLVFFGVIANRGVVFLGVVMIYGI